MTPVNIEDPVISRMLAASLQWLPTEKRQEALSTVSQLESIEEVELYLSTFRAGASGESFKA